ncbi:MAG: hypothetical protein COA82_12405 [Alkaliphilus sp.]|nr:hypothetical protein [bacterium AH-315-L21]PHS29728.1 MAG: hypothetical protein COA82_12405 [Alkaliphilus sp.]
MKRVVILLLLILLFISGCQNENNVSVLRQTPINGDLLNKMYYENEYSAFFYSNMTDCLIKNNINEYSLSWLITLSDLLCFQLSEEVDKAMMNAHNESMPEKLNVGSNKKLIELLNSLKVNRYKNRSIENLEKVEFIKILMGYYDNELGLFKVDDDNTEMIQTTNIILQIFDLLEEIPNEVLGKTVDSHKVMLSDEDFFDMEETNIKKNLVDSGIIILDSLIILDKYSPDNLNVFIVEKKEWILYWQQAANEILLNNNINPIMLNHMLNSLYKVSSYIELEYRINEEYYTRISVTNLKELFFTDLQAFYKSILVYENFGFELAEEIEKLIALNMNYWIYEDQPHLNIKELYFGIKIAEEIGFKFNADKILFALRNYYDTENLETLYYLMLINEEFNMMDSKKEFFAMKSKRFFDDNQIWADVLLSDMYYISEILLKADYEDDNLPHQIKELLMDIKITAIESDKELYIYVKLARIYDLNIDKEKLATKIDEFFLEGKSFFHDSRYKKVNLFSTYRMIYLKSMYSLKIDQKELSSIHSFIESLATNYGGYFMTSTYGNNYFKNFSTNFSFESCYYGYEIVDLIRNM